MRFRLFSMILALVGALLLGACGPQLITAEEIVERMEATRDSMQDVHATVAMNFNTNERDGYLVIEGWLEKTGQTDADGMPINKVRATVIDADEEKLSDSLVVSDGEIFWLYNPYEQTAITGDIAEMKANRPDSSAFSGDPTGMTEAFQDMLQQGLDAVDIEVLGEETIAGRAAWKLKLTPKTETQQQLQLDGIIEATMWVEQEQAIPLKLDVDASDMGQVTIEVQSIEMNVGLDDSLFVFTPPEGVKVLQAADLLAEMQPRSTTLDEAQDSVDFPVLTPEFTPDDATLVEVRLIGTHTVIQNYAAPGVSLSVVQGRGDVGDADQPPADSVVEEVMVRGHTATLVTGADDQQGALLSWTEDGRRVIIAGTLSADEALQVAESLK